MCETKPKMVLYLMPHYINVASTVMQTAGRTSVRRANPSGALTVRSTCSCSTSNGVLAVHQRNVHVVSIPSLSGGSTSGLGYLAGA